MGGHRKGNGSGFDIALWGYDRRQVDRCLDDLTAQLNQAIGQLDAVDALHAQLCQANVEIGQLRLEAEQNPPWDERLAGIMAAAEQLWRQAADRKVEAGARPE